MSKHVVANVEEIAPGGRKLVELEGRPIVIFNLEGEYFALLNRCPRMAPAQAVAGRARHVEPDGHQLGCHRVRLTGVVEVLDPDVQVEPAAVAGTQAEAIELQLLDAGHGPPQVRTRGAPA